VAVGDGHQLFGAVSPHAHDDQCAQACLFQADVEVDAVGPDVDEVTVVEAALGEGSLVGLPLSGEAGDDRCRQAGGGAEELLEGGGEVTRAHAVQVHQWQHLGDLWALAAPRRDDHRREPPTLPGLVIDAAIVDTGRLDVDPARRRRDGACLGVAVAGHQTATSIIELVDEGGHVTFDLGLEGGHQHPAGALPDDLIEPAREFRVGVVVSQYSQHRRSFLAGVSPPANSFWSTRKVRRAFERVVDPQVLVITRRQTIPTKASESAPLWDVAVADPSQNDHESQRSGHP